MPLSQNQRAEITELLHSTIEKKLKNYGSETDNMPFLKSLIKDNAKVASYSFIHSVATTLGMSIHEKVSAIIAGKSCDEVKTQYKLTEKISSKRKDAIADIIAGLKNKERRPDIQREVAEVLQAPDRPAKIDKDGRIVDFYMKREGIEHYFEIKSPKPNTSEFKVAKTKMLAWVARIGKPVRVYLALPYNPYAPNPYKHFAGMDLMDHPRDLLIGPEYWNFLGGQRTFEQLLSIYEEAGTTYRHTIQRKFHAVAKKSFGAEFK